jgi:hypothetical protein
MALPPNSFLETIIASLLPYFSAASMDKHEARSEIIDTLAAYETRTRAEMLQAAHIIAFGMTTIDVLAEAKTAEMSQSMRLRYRSCANSLNRSTLQTEKALDQRLGDEPSSRPRRNAGAHRRHAAGRDNGRHTAIQSEDRHPAPSRPPRHRPASPHGRDVEPRTLGQRDAGLVAAAGRSGPNLPIDHDAATLESYGEEWRYLSLNLCTTGTCADFVQFRPGRFG